MAFAAGRHTERRFAAPARSRFVDAASNSLPAGNFSQFSREFNWSAANAPMVAAQLLS
jgi:hypothetical protein